MTLKKNKEISIVTLGCSKNTVDSESLLRQFEAAGFKAEHAEEATTSRQVVINTCGFIGDAKQESIDTILRFAEARKSGKIDKLIVMGCLAQRYQAELAAEIPEVDGWFGVNDQPKIVESAGLLYRDELLGERVLSTPPHYAYLKIAEGCDRQCSFCAIPMIRGKHVSRTLESLMEEAAKLSEQGVKEIMLISQDLTYYGVDLYKKQMLTELVRQLSDSRLFRWIRLHYLFPTSFPDDLLPLMRERDNICNYIDIPLQHVNSRILKSMRRGVNATQTQQLIDRFRTELPDAAIRTSFIVGYPGETQEEMEELLNFISHNRFDRVGVFTYSHEEDTHAFQLPDDVPEDEKNERAANLMKLQEQIAFELNQKLEGKSLEVIIDRLEGDYWIGRTQYDSPEVDNEVLVDMNTHPNLKPGELYRMTIDSVDQFDLFATPISDDPI